MRNNRPRGSPEVKVRSVRVADVPWAKAVRRATYEGMTMSEVLHRFVIGYGEGLIDPPQTRMVYAGRAREVQDAGQGAGSTVDLA